MHARELTWNQYNQLWDRIDRIMVRLGYGVTNVSYLKTWSLQDIELLQIAIQKAKDEILKNEVLQNQKEIQVIRKEIQQIQNNIEQNQFNIQQNRENIDHMAKTQANMQQNRDIIDQNKKNIQNICDAIAHNMGNIKLNTNETQNLHQQQKNMQEKIQDIERIWQEQYTGPTNDDWINAEIEMDEREFEYYNINPNDYTEEYYSDTD